jgi:hypothetical protein
MPDTFTETTTTGWLDQIKNAIAGVLVGLVLFVVAFPLLFWNEGNFVKTKKALEEGEGQTITVKADTVDKSNEGKLVHMIGGATTEDTLTDESFPVSARAIKLIRKAEMYQWEEETKTTETKKTGGSVEKKTEYSYKKVWADHRIDSNGFKKSSEYANPAQMKYEGKEYKAQKVTVGAFRLSGSLVDQINKEGDLKLDDKMLASWPADIKAQTRVNNGGLYFGTDAANPNIGDVRIFFKVVLPTTVSLISKQVNDTFEPFIASNGKQIADLVVGEKSKEQMYAGLKQANATMTWILRLVGFVMMLIGLTLIAKPLVAVANVLPFLGDLVSGGALIFGGIIAFGLSFITISVAWVFYRPLVGIPLLVVGVGAVVGFIVMKKRGKTPAA